MNTVILGGTRGMGRAVARQISVRGDRVFLLGRDVQSLRHGLADLTARRAEPPREEEDYAICDLEDPETFAPALEAAREAMGRIDCVIVTAALFGTQDQLEADEAFAHRLLTVNFANTVLFCEIARKLLLAGGGGTLCVFSSVAGERGRKPVAIYGASKAGLSHYLESLDHKFRAEGLRTICVKPGFVKTGMTAGLKPPPFAGEPEQVAALVVQGIEQGTPLVYAPRIWALVMFAIKMLPRLIMRRIGF